MEVNQNYCQVSKECICVHNQSHPYCSKLNGEKGGNASLPISIEMAQITKNLLDIAKHVKSDGNCINFKSIEQWIFVSNKSDCISFVGATERVSVCKKIYFLEDGENTVEKALSRMLEI